MAHCFAFPEVFTTHEPVMLSLLCSESIPFPGVVDAAAVVVANEGNTVGDELPASRPPTIEPCPGKAWLMTIGCAVEGSVGVDDNASLRDVELLVPDEDGALVLDALNAAATPAEKTKTKIARTLNVRR